MKKKDNKELKLTGGFVLTFGTGIASEWIKTDTWHALIITQHGVYFDGKLVAKGKLKLCE